MAAPSSTPAVSPPPDEAGGAMLWLSRRAIAFTGAGLCGWVLALGALEMQHFHEETRHTTGQQLHDQAQLLAQQIQSSTLLAHKELERAVQTWQAATGPVVERLTYVGAARATLPWPHRLCHVQALDASPSTSQSTSQSASQSASASASHAPSHEPSPAGQRLCVEPAAATPAPSGSSSARRLALRLQAPLPGARADANPTRPEHLVLEVDEAAFVGHLQAMLPSTEVALHVWPRAGQPDASAGWPWWMPADLAPAPRAVPWPQESSAWALSAAPGPLSERWEERLQEVGAAVALSLGLLAFLTASALRSWRAREQLQARLSQTRTALHQQLSFSAHLLEASPTPTYVKDRGGRYLHVNGAYERHVGKPREHLLGRTIEDLFPGLDTSSHRAQDLAVMASGEVVSTEYHRLLADEQADDTMLVTKAPLHDEAGQVIGLIGTITDITALKRAERSIAAARDAAQAANEAKSEFIGNMSHELRTPLQSILGFSELGIARTQAEPRLQDMFKTIWRGGDRMLGLVNDLLDLSKLDAHHQDMRITPKLLKEAVDDALQELAPLAANRRITLLAQVPGEVQVAVDPLRFWQVLRNVLANALKFAPEGSAIEMRHHEDAAGWTVLDVLDQGPGIPDAELESIFSPFVQSSRTKDGSGGTGLGLAICRRILEAHGGRIEAHNREGGGACFRLSLPPVNCGDGWAATVAPSMADTAERPCAHAAPTSTEAQAGDDGLPAVPPAGRCASCPARQHSGKDCLPPALSEAAPSPGPHEHA